MGIKSNNKAESYFNFFGSSSPGGGAGGGSGGPPLSVTGGNTSYTYNDKKIHVWTSPGPFVVTGGPASLEYFVVAGGGSGGADMGGGGGGGGVLTGSITLTGPFSTTVTVGDGGTAQPRGSSTPDAAKGSPSVLNNPDTAITSIGGGFGQGDNDPDADFAAESCGSGGGGYGQGHPNDGGPAPDATQGNPGFRTLSPNKGGGGGGGGTGGPALTQQQNGGFGLAIPTTFQDPSNPYGGPNGPTQPSITGNFYFAGGGGGGHPSSGSAWGGGGSNTDPADPGTANTGGGGAGGPGSGGNPGGDGGKGIVFVAYTPA